MSKLGCICGHTIVDQTDNIPYKASFIRDEDLERTYDHYDDVDAFINAIKNGERQKWLDKYFGKGLYTNISDSSVINDIIRRYISRFESDIFLCENCGRIKIQNGNTNMYTSFLPEDNNWTGIFKGISNNSAS